MNYNISGVCSKSVSFDLENGKLKNVKFVGGCPGNLAAIGKIVEGMEPQFVIDRFKGNTCGAKRTSCVDQFALALEAEIAKG